MPVTKVECDCCGIETSDFVLDYDNVVRCTQCQLLTAAQEARQSYEDLKHWLETTHLLKLAKLKAEVERLEQQVKQLKEPPV